MEISDYKKLLKQMLSEKRYNHSLCVADEAKRLAIKYGANEDDMYLAGLLHDITKFMPNEEQLKLFDDFGIMLTENEKSTPEIWHAMSGAIYIERFLQIKNRDILSAVRYHTTAKANMSLNEKIIYVADLTAADRNYPDVEEIREKSNKSLEETMVAILKFTINNLLSKNKPIHPDTLEAYNFLCIGEI
jgi:nicotinate-nucleotide adenylyltransferase